MGYKSMLPAVSSKPHMQDKYGGKDTFDQATILQYGFAPVSWLLIGASLQALAVYLFSSGRYVLLISTVALLAKVGKMVLQAYNILPNPYLQDVIEGRVTALTPDKESGEIATPAGEKIVVFHLGAKSNHPFGFFAPQFQGVGKWVARMNAAMDSGEVTGFLGQTTFHRMDERGAPEVVLISYWQSIEDLWKFAHTGVHREGWNWWEKTIKDNGYVAINHEIFEADAHHWENIYVNFQPTLMGATTYLKKGGKTLEGGIVPDEWISPIVEAKKGKLARSSGRMGREIQIFDMTRVAKDVYQTDE